MSFCHARIDADPEALVHNGVRVEQGGGDTIINAFAQGFKTGMAREVAGKEISGLDLVLFQMFSELVAGDGGLGGQGHQEAEPGGLGAWQWLLHAKPGNILDALIQAGVVLLALFDEGGKFLKLGAADGRLQVGGF